METALDQGSAIVGERARTRQGKLIRARDCNASAAKGRQCRARLRSGSVGRGWWRQCRARLVAQGLATGGSGGGEGFWTSDRT